MSGRPVHRTGSTTPVGRRPLTAATTWLFVRIRPSELSTMPDPSSLPCPMLICSFTTLGSTFAATCSTEPDGGAATGWWGRGAAAGGGRGGAVGRGRVRLAGQHRGADTARTPGRHSRPRHDDAGSRTLPHQRESVLSVSNQPGTQRRTRPYGGWGAAWRSASRRAVDTRPGVEPEYCWLTGWLGCSRSVSPQRGPRLLFQWH